MKDEKIICEDCKQEFVFTAGEQEFYNLKGIKNKPKRCKECREKRKASFNNNRRSNYNN